MTQLTAAIGGPTEAQQRANHGQARSRAASMRGDSPLIWAQQIHADMLAGHLRPLTELTATATEQAQREAGDERYADATREALLRSTNADRVRSLILAIRRLAASKDPRDIRMREDMSRFLRDTWGLKRAADAFADKGRDLQRELLQHWGEAQLPPDANLVLAGLAVDEHLIRACVRRVFGR